MILCSRLHSPILQQLFNQWYKWTPHQIFPTKHRSRFSPGYFTKEEAKLLLNHLMPLLIYEPLKFVKFHCLWVLMLLLMMMWARTRPKHRLKMDNEYWRLRVSHIHNWCGCGSIYFWRMWKSFGGNENLGIYISWKKMMLFKSVEDSKNRFNDDA